MTRDHTIFIQSQCLPWTADGLGAVHAGLESRLLSGDPATGAATLLLQIPAGWRRTDSYYLSALEEFYVLDGELTIGTQHYAAHTYACLAAGRYSTNAPGGGDSGSGALGAAAAMVFQAGLGVWFEGGLSGRQADTPGVRGDHRRTVTNAGNLSLIHISEPKKTY